jgi:GT2 family glycosyltransferase
MRCVLVLINYNGGEMVLETLKSLYAQPAGAEFELLIVDNASTDDSIDQIKKLYPQAKVELARKNLGFGRAINLAIEKLESDGYKGEYICLIQPDMMFTSGWLGELIDCADSNPQVAAVNPVVVYADHFRFFNVKTTNPKIYLQHEDYRLFAPFVGDDSARSQEITLKGMQLLQPNRSEFQLALAESYSKLELQVYDEQLSGYHLRVQDKETVFPALLALASKFAFKLSKDLKLKFRKFQLQEFAIPTEEMVNAVGSSFRGDSRLPENNYYGAKLTDLPTSEHEVELFYGACALLRLKCVQEVGKFDPDFFMYYEESDLAMRLRLAGYKIFATPASRVYHKERGSRSDKVMQYMLDSQRLFQQKWSVGDISKIALL